MRQLIVPLVIGMRPLLFMLLIVEHGLPHHLPLLLLGHVGQVLVIVSGDGFLLAELTRRTADFPGEEDRLAGGVLGVVRSFVE